MSNFFLTRNRVVDIAEWKITAWAFDYWLWFFVSGDYLQVFLCSDTILYTSYSGVE